MSIPDKTIQTQTSRQHIAEAVAVLAENGYEVSAPPLPMLQRGILLTAYNLASGDGYLLAAAEVRLLAFYGDMRILAPDCAAGQARWQHPDVNRERAYVEAALARAVAEVAAAPEGNRNNLLVRAAFALGGLEHLGLDRERTVFELAQAAVAAGLHLSEAEATARGGFARGAEQPREMPESQSRQTARFGRFFTGGRL